MVTVAQFVQQPATQDFYPVANNTYNLGNASEAWAQLYLGVNKALALDPSGGNIANYVRSAIETAASATIAQQSTPSSIAIGDIIVDRYLINVTPGTTDMTAGITAAIAVAAEAGGGVVRFLASTYKFSGQINVPSNVILRGMGMYQTVLNWVASNTNAIYAGAVSGFGIEDLTLNGPGILSSTYCNGIYMDTGSSNGSVTRCFITGFPQMPPFTPSTRGYGVTLEGTNLTLSHSRIEDSTYCVVLGGYGNNVIYNYINQHYSTKGVIPWGTGSTSQFWGGIDVGAFYFLIHGNYITDCGAGNIYVGGNGGISQNGRITCNFSSYSWDRCLDNGVVGTVSSGDNVIGITIANNVLYNGRNNNLWLAGTSDSAATGNICIYDAAYDTWAGGAFVTYPGTRISIGLYDGGAGAPLKNLALVGNTSIDTVNPGISFSYGTNPPTNCVISGNVTQSGYYIYPGAHIANSIDAEVVVPLTGGLAPVATGWTGQSIASQTSSVTFVGRSAYWSIALTLGTASSPSGDFLLTLPYIASMNLVYESFNVNIISGWNTTLASDYLTAYVSNPSAGEVVVGRIHQGTLVADAVGFTATGSTITIKGQTNF
jgi:hypothetical protein